MAEFLAYQTLVGNKLDTRTLGEYYMLIQEPDSAGRFIRYQAFQSAFPSNRDFAADYLTFNALFNRGRDLPLADKLLIFNSLAQNSLQYADMGDLYFMCSVLFRKSGDSPGPATRLLAFRILIRDNPGGDILRDAAAGFAYDSKPLTVSVSMGLRGREFRGNDNVPDHHRWGQLQVTGSW